MDIYDPSRQSSFIEIQNLLSSRPFTPKEQLDSSKQAIRHILEDYPHLSSILSHVEKIAQYIASESIKKLETQVAELEGNIKSLSEDIGMLLAFRDNTVAEIKALKNQKQIRRRGKHGH